MVNHPNRKNEQNPAGYPSAAEIRYAREEAGLTQTQAAALVHTTLRVWQQWESSVKGDARRMHPATWDLFQLNSGAMLRKSHKLLDWLHNNLGDSDVPASHRIRAAGTCFTIVRDHHGAVVHLIEEKHPSPAFALARSVYEGYVRGQWLLHCASDAQVERFLNGEDFREDTGKKKNLCLRDLITALEATSAFPPGSLANIRDKAWPALCDYAHVGGRLISYWSMPGSVEINFPTKDVEDVLRLTGVIAVLAALGIRELAQGDLDDQLLEGMLAQVREFAPLKNREEI